MSIVSSSPQSTGCEVELLPGGSLGLFLRIASGESTNSTFKTPKRTLEHSGDAMRPKVSCRDGLASPEKPRCLCPEDASSASLPHVVQAKQLPVRVLKHPAY